MMATFGPSAPPLGTMLPARWGPLPWVLFVLGVTFDTIMEVFGMMDRSGMTRVHLPKSAGARRPCTPAHSCSAGLAGPRHLHRVEAGTVATLSLGAHGGLGPPRRVHPLPTTATLANEGGAVERPIPPLLLVNSCSLACGLWEDAVPTRLRHRRLVAVGPRRRPRERHAPPLSPVNSCLLACGPRVAAARAPIRPRREHIAPALAPPCFLRCQPSNAAPPGPDTLRRTRGQRGQVERGLTDAPAGAFGARGCE